MIWGVWCCAFTVLIGECFVHEWAFPDHMRVALSSVPSLSCHLWGWILGPISGSHMSRTELAWLASGLRQKKKTVSSPVCWIILFSWSYHIWICLQTSGYATVVLEILQITSSPPPPFFFLIYVYIYSRKADYTYKKIEIFLYPRIFALY